VPLEVLESWRVVRGEARFPRDLGEGSLPNEAGLEMLIDHAEKGCFLGQEAVAKTRTLGRPPFAVIAARAEGEAEPGQMVLAGDEEVGKVTSAATVDEGSSLIARVRWSSRERDLSVGGERLEVLGLASGAG
jgi:folate-binding protein YgfZ